MSNNESCSHLTSEDESKDLVTFCMQLVHRSQSKSCRSFVSGSSVEITQYIRIVQDIGVSHQKLDIDMMSYTNDVYAVDRSKLLPETYTGDIVRYYTDEMHVGYARLIAEKDNSEVHLSSLYTLTDDRSRHGPAMLVDTEKYAARYYNYSLSEGNLSVHKPEGKMHISSSDIVIAIHCPYWPVEASEWITRRRSRGFPPKSVVKQVVRYGCDFVQVSHNRVSNDNEWRFSFSRAELYIVKSWSISQRIVYTSLWALNKRIASSNLCSYYFKTLVFWACERKSTRFWDEHLLVECVRELLIEMTNCVRSKFCANYFIPSNNMMDHLVDRDLSYETDALCRISQSHQIITDVVRICRKSELQFANTTHRIEAPAWYVRALVIYHRVNNDCDTYTDLFHTDLTTDLRSALYVELSDIYRGLHFHKTSASCGSVSDKPVYFLKSETALLLALNLCESQERGIIDNCNSEIVESMFFKLMSRDSGNTSSVKSHENFALSTTRGSTADNGRNSFNNNYYLNKQKCLLYNRSVERQECQLANNYGSDQISVGRKVRLALYRVMTMNTPAETDVEFYKEWPGQSPTVNVSWFIVKAYLANLYYTTQRDVSLTIKTCDDIIDVYRQSMMNKNFAEKAFPVVLSTQWTNIYDKAIQELLGFCSLCAYVLVSSSRSVYLGVCPVQFALYIKLRAVIDQLTTNEDQLRRSTIVVKHIERYTDHIEVCDCDEQTNHACLMYMVAMRKYQWIMQFNSLQYFYITK